VHQPVFVYIVFGGLMAWSVYRRVRRSIGRQQLRPRRAIVRLVILCAASVLIALAGLQFPRILLGFGGGLLCGAILGFVGLKLTQFETTEEGHFYTPDTRIGVALSLLLAGRIIYRMVVLSNTDLAANHPPPMQSPLTYFIIGLTIGYYIVYSIGLFVHTHDKKPLPPAGSV
jgi:MFS family permease